ncbi:hypothetical protein ACIRN4_15875 [Pimelobacter simplex]|uniref:hypothetical protein n=1 Tax=Nocardioides simplex TaxID=2045 RepID=UPI003671B346
MASHRASHRASRRWFGRGRTRALLATGLLLGVGAVGTSAYWSTGATVTGVQATAGAIHIDLAGAQRVKPETYAWTDLGGNLSTAGGSQAKVIRVRNNSTGAVRFSYDLAASAPNTTFGNALQVTVRKGGSVSGTSCTGGTLVGGAGANLRTYTATVGTISSWSAAPYDDLCVQVTLPAGSGVTGGSTAALTFTFSATQVVS